MIINFDRTGCVTVMYDEILSFRFVIACMSAMHGTINNVDPCATDRTEWSTNTRNLLLSALTLRDALHVL